MLVETDESVYALAGDQQARLDQLTKEDYKRMGIKREILMSRVQYQCIAELQKRDLQCIKRKEQFRQRLVRAWGGDWEDQLQGLLPRELNDGFLARLGRFATGAGQTLTKKILRQGFLKSIEDRQDSCRTSKANDIQIIDITRFEERLASPCLYTAVAAAHVLPTTHESSLVLVSDRGLEQRQEITLAAGM